MKKLILAALILSAGLLADDFDDADKAYKAGGYQKAAKLFQKVCDGGVAGGCSNLGHLYYNGQGLRQDKSRAKEYYGKACDLGHQPGCDNYKKLNEQGY